MIKTALSGFCMALADSVPGVSGGTVAFILGFYDQFIGSIHDLVYGPGKKRKPALLFLLKLGCGWVIGMILAVLILTSLFESHIHVVSSVFIGFIAGSIPLIIHEERESFRHVLAGVWFAFIGAALVVLITWANGHVSTTSMDLSQFSALQALKLFVVGMIAVSAMFLPGISGSTMLLIFGAYMPVMNGVRGLLGLDFAYLPSIIVFILGIVVGAASVVKGIQYCLEKFRPQAMYLILGMLLGSFYAIVQGPTTLDPPQEAVTWGTFSWIGCLVGLAIVIGLQLAKSKMERGKAAAPAGDAATAAAAVDSASGADAMEDAGRGAVKSGDGKSVDDAAKEDAADATTVRK